MAITPPLIGGEKTHWWLTNRKIVDKYVKDAKTLINSNEKLEITSALNILDSALTILPRSESALELKARALLSIRRFKEVADMLQDYIPSFKLVSEDSTSSGSSENSSSHQLSRERSKLLPGLAEPDFTFKCFSVKDLKKRVMAGLSTNSEKEGHWRYLVLGQACYHLGLMEDAMVLLQTGKRLATLSSRQESKHFCEDNFSNPEINDDLKNNASITVTSEASNLAQLLGHIKVLLCRRTAATSALEGGHHSEAIRHFSKILDGRRGIPQGFLAECYVHRANAYRSAGRIAEAIADCNRTLALEPTCIPALTTRANLLETIRSVHDCLRDYEHLKLLYDAILRDGKLPGPAWRRHNVHYRDVQGNLRMLTSKIQELRQRVGLESNVDYYALVGLRRGCSRSELERAHLLLTLRHGPDKGISFIDRCEFLDYHDLELVKDQARMSALLLYRLLQKAYSNIMSTIMDEQAAEKQRQKAANALQVAAAAAAASAIKVPESKRKPETTKPAAESRLGSGLSTYKSRLPEKMNSAMAASVFQGSLCRDIVIVGNLLSKANFNHSIPVKYEALSC